MPIERPLGILNVMEQFWTQLENLKSLIRDLNPIEKGEMVLGLPATDVLQFAVVFGLLLISLKLRPRLEEIHFSRWGQAVSFFKRIAFPVTFLLMLIFSRTIIATMALPVTYIDIASLVVAIWMTPKVVEAFSLKKQTRRLVVLLIWVMLALSMTDKLDTFIGFLNSAELKLGEVHLSLWSIIKAVGVFTVLVWGFSFGTKLLEDHLMRTGMRPAARTLLNKLINTAGIVLAFLVSLNVIGIDVAALAVFGGALGIGLGFGLKTITSNFISGIILLMDKSIKPGDVISIGDSYGVIIEMHARYVVMRRRDGTEVLIPNESLMISEVINWSFNNRKVRQTLEVGVSYNSDMEQVQKILLDVCKDNPRVLEDPAPRAFISAFGDSSVNFYLRFWQTDPEAGVSNLKGDLYMDIWKEFKKQGVEIPFPQRVLHMAEDAKSPNLQGDNQLETTISTPPKESA